MVGGMIDNWDGCIEVGSIQIPIFLYHSIHPSIYPSIWVSNHISIHSPIFFYRSINLSIHPSPHASIHCYIYKVDHRCRWSLLVLQEYPPTYRIQQVSSYSIYPIVYAILSMWCYTIYVPYDAALWVISLCLSSKKTMMHIVFIMS